MPNHPRMIGDLRFAAATIMGVRMSRMVMRVNAPGSAMLAEIATGVVWDRIPTAAANHARLVCTLLIDAMRLPQAGIDAEIGRRDAAAGQVSADRARRGIFGLAHVAPVSETAVLLAFVVVERHGGSSQSLFAGIKPLLDPCDLFLSELAPNRLWRNRPASAGRRRSGECRIRTWRLEWPSTRRHSECRPRRRCGPRPARNRG
jgi:hypothetical protein